MTSRTSFFANKHITVIGLGITGMAVAKRLAAMGSQVLVTDVKPASAFKPELVEELKKLKVQFEFNNHTSQVLAKAQLIVISPGVHLDLPVLSEARERGLAIISEIELASQLLEKPIIAVTGTNGKTTTTALIGEILKAGGKRVAVAGNIGYPLVSVDDSDLDFMVAEISSYQLEAITSFRPWISVMLNIQEDHLERHHSMQEYISQKARIFMNQDQNDFCVYNADDPLVSSLVKRTKSKLIPFAKSNLETIGLKPQEIRIPGRHNLENALAAAQVALLCGVSRETIASVLRSFSGVSHRFEFVAEVKGIKFYDDSKATNPDSTLVALETFSGQEVILILGGRDKGVSLSALCKKIKGEVKKVVLMGEATDRFKKELNKFGIFNIHLVGSMDEAVKYSFRLGIPGDIVLLSPACASFDMFTNFEERGRVFKESVGNLY